MEDQLPNLPDLDDPRPVLEHLGLEEPVFLGRGIGSQVFDRGDGTAVKIHSGVDRAYLDTLQAFYAGLAPYSFPFAVPRIHRIGRVGATHFTIEQRLPGETLFRVLPRLRGRPRRLLLERYLAAVDAFSQITLPPDQPYGQVLAHSPVHAPTWRAFLETMIQDGLAKAAADLRADLGASPLRSVEAYFERELPFFDTLQERTLVHGDYWGDNVLVHQTNSNRDEWSVSAVLDFAGMTLCGDPRLDVAAAVAFLEMRPGYPTEDSDFLLQAAIARHGTAIEPVIRFYRLWYAAVYAFCKPFDSLTYGWSLHTFRQYLVASA